MRFRLDFLFMRSSINRLTILGYIAIVLSCGMLALGFLLLTSLSGRDVGADTLSRPEITCDDFPAWNLADDHFASLDSDSIEARVLDSNGNGVPCEGLMPRSRHPSEEFDVVCDDFQHRDEAEYFFETYESPGQNRYGLDRDRDGRPCEAVPPLDEINRVLSRLNRLWRDESQSGGDADCGDFDNWDEANAFFIRNGGPDSDPHRLDGDSNGVPCESLPGAP